MKLLNLIQYLSAFLLGSSGKVGLLRKLNVGNFQEAIENFADCPNMFETLLKRVKFL